MKKIIFIFVFIVINKLYCQEAENQLYDIINKCFYCVLMYNKENYEKHDNYKKLSDNYIFIDNFPNGFEFSKKILKFKMKTLNFSNLTEEQKGKGVFGYYLASIEINKNNLTIYINSKSGKINENVFFVGVNSDGYKFELKYNCEKEKWELQPPNPNYESKHYEYLYKHWY